MFQLTSARASRFWFLVAASNWLCSCSTGADAARCPKQRIEVPVDYAGAIVGVGEITITPREHATLEAILSITFQTPEASATLNLQGVGTCTTGIIRIRLGGATADRGPYRVLGATLESLYQPELIETSIFGAWSAKAVLEENGTVRSIEGYFRARDKKL